jgi:hypothetical protein
MIVFSFYIIIKKIEFKNILVILYYEIRVLANMNHLHLLSRTAKIRYPFCHKYIENLEHKGMLEDAIINEIELLNKASLYKPANIKTRLGFSLLLSIPFTPIAGLVYFIATMDDKNDDAIKAETKYIKFENKE